MHKALRYGFASLSLLAFGVLAMPTSQARSSPAFLGQAQSPADQPCFNNAFGKVQNSCPTTRRFCMALPVDSSFHAIGISVFTQDINHNISCFGQAVDIFGRDAGVTRPTSPTMFGVLQSFGLLDNSNVPNSGGLYLCCDIPPGNGGSLNVVNW